MPIDYFHSPLGYLVRLPQPDDAADSPLTDAAKHRAEEAARFLAYGPTGPVVSSHDAAALETAQIIYNATATGIEIDLRIEDPETLCAYLQLNQLEDRGHPYVLVLRQSAIAAAFARMGVSPSVGDSLSVPEIVAPGGIISVHRSDEGKIQAIARTMILDFTFSDFANAVTAEG